MTNQNFFCHAKITPHLGMATSRRTSPCILRCNILDKKTGVCLFEKIWSWPVVASPHDVSKLILSFHQISGELGSINKGTLYYERTSTLVRLQLLLRDLCIARTQSLVESVIRFDVLQCLRIEPSNIAF